MNEEKKRKNKIIGISIGILVVLLVVISSTYAYWQITKSQDGSNDIIAACLDIDMQSVDGTFGLDPAWPISDNEGMNLTGYKFKVTNNCPEDVNYVIGMDSLEVSGATYLSYDSIKVSMDNAPAMIYGEQEDIEHIAEENDDYVIRDSKKIATAIVKNGQPNEHIVKVWIKSDAPVEEQSKVFSGRMFITGGQNIENDKPLAQLIATGDISKTENDKVTYSFYDNGDIIISGTGETKDFKDVEFLEELFTKSLEYYNIELTSDEQAIIGNETLFGYYGLAIYNKEYYTEFKSSGSLKTREDVINMVKNTTEYGDVFEDLVEKCSKIKFKNIIIDNGVTAIGAYMFNSLVVDSIYISDSVNTIYRSVFVNVGVENIRLSENLITLGGSSFSGAVLKSKSLYLPDSIKEIYNYLILASNIEVLKLPNNSNLVTTDEVFTNANNLNTIIIPEKITKLPNIYGMTQTTENIILKFYGPERTIEGLDTTKYKEVIWNYTE